MQFLSLNKPVQPAKAQQKIYFFSFWISNSCKICHEDRGGGDGSS